uniref:Uncharacterized protein n=1 Tax=Cyprinus carpio TaxID=7962 RepID=A0A8C1TQI6_CYPCA
LFPTMQLSDLKTEMLSRGWIIMTYNSIFIFNRLSDCSISEEGYKALSSALRSNPSHLIELDLTGNDPGPSGVKQLSDLLQDPNCQLKTLSLCGCSITEKQCLILTSALKSNPSHLRELNLSGNKLLGDSGVNHLSDLLMNTQFKLKKLELVSLHSTKQCLILTSALKSNPSHLRELILSWNQIKNTGVNHLCDVLKDSRCKLERLRSVTFTYKNQNDENHFAFSLGQGSFKMDCGKVENCSVLTEKSCSVLATVLSSKTILKEMNLNNSRLLDSGVKEICEGLKNPVCDSCTQHHTTVLSSKTILKEMNLNNSRLLDSGVKEICEGLKNPVCELKILKLSDCSISEEGYKALSSALRSNPSHLIELDLTGNDPGPSGVKQLSDLLQDPNCQLKTLR